ncbi:MAG: DNA topoisomerase (ATP-hydrolyzing) subunit B [Candidatus Eisenbacteria bacterium]
MAKGKKKTDKTKKAKNASKSASKSRPASKGRKVKPSKSKKAKVSKSRPSKASAQKKRTAGGAKSARPKKRVISKAQSRSSAKPSGAAAKSAARKGASKPKASRKAASKATGGKKPAARKSKAGKPETKPAVVETSIDKVVVEEFPLEGAGATATDAAYEAKHIQVLKGLEAVRKRPAMYIGDTGRRGLHHLIYEVVDNSVDEAMAGYCDKISVVIHKDGSVSVADNGRGIPVDKHPIQKRSALEVVMTVLHAGGKFDKQSYKVSGGLHGVGVSVVNALSEWCKVEVAREGTVYAQSYVRGVPEEKVKPVGKRKKSGNKTTFYPDREVFEETDFDFETVASRCRELAFLNAGLIITVDDERSGESVEHRYKGGLREFVKFMNENTTALHTKVVHFEKTRDDTAVEIALQYNDTYRASIYSYANNINTIEGGTHLTGFKQALTRTINTYGDKNNLLGKGGETVSGDDCLEGLAAVVSVKVKEPQFEGQTKTKLGNSEVKGVVASIVGEGLQEFFEETPSVARKIVSKAVSSSHARAAARKARDLTRRKSVLESGSLPGKLADCSITDPEHCEIFLVEGDSAGGSAKSGRDRRFQAILPLRGKVLNVFKARLDKVFHNVEIGTIITALGTGVSETGDGDDEGFNISKLRYGKTIIMTDADVDGAHIRTLLLTFFYRFMVELIETGHLYIAQPPLYRVKKGKEEFYCYDEKELAKTLKRVGRENADLQRFKGLGEMNPDQLWATTMDPERRVMLQVSIDSAAEADHTFSILMGDAVEPRRKFIETHAKQVRNLDI